MLVGWIDDRWSHMVQELLPLTQAIRGTSSQKKPNMYMYTCTKKVVHVIYLLSVFFKIV